MAAAVAASVLANGGRRRTSSWAPGPAGAEDLPGALGNPRRKTWGATYGRARALV